MAAAERNSGTLCFGNLTQSIVLYAVLHAVSMPSVIVLLAALSPHTVIIFFLVFCDTWQSSVLDMTQPTF